MIRINLISYRVARRQQQIMQHLNVFIGVIVVAVLLALAAHTSSSLNLTELKEETLQLQNQNQELKKKIGKIENLASLRADVEHKLEVVDRLQEGRFRSLKTLNEIAQLIPENVWLTKIKDNGDTLELSGLGQSNKAVASFMRKLDRSPLFSNIQLSVISRVTREGVPVRKFSLEMNRLDDAAAVKKGKS